VTILKLYYRWLIYTIKGWCATLGPKTGLRQVSISRYSMGWWPVKIIAFLNVIEQVSNL